MALLFDDASSEYVFVNTAAITAAPCTFACWFYPDDDANIGGLVTCTDKDVNNTDDFLMYFRGDVAGNPIRARMRRAFSLEATSTNGSTLNAWNHGVAIFDTSDPYATAVLNGDWANRGTQSSQYVPLNLDRTGAGGGW